MARLFYIALLTLLAGDPSTGVAQEKKPSQPDRQSPRAMLQTFYFAATAYLVDPALIDEAIDCLDIPAEDLQRDRQSAALQALQLGEVLAQISLPLYAVPERARSDNITLLDDGSRRIALAKQADGSWRFDRQTVEQIPRLHQVYLKTQREIQEARTRLAEGRTDPETTMRHFLREVIRKNYVAAAVCLDLSGLTPSLRSSRGPLLARKLAFVLQRCGMVYTQELPSHPDSPRYTWRVTAHGLIILERVPLGDGKDAWLFSRATLAKLNDMVQELKGAAPHPGYVRLGMVINARDLVDESAPVAAPEGVAPELASARATLKTFFEAVDGLDHAGDNLKRATSCLDLNQLTQKDRRFYESRLVVKLDAVLRGLNLDLLTVSDQWNDEPQTFARGSSQPVFQVTLARQPDGCWRFDQETVARIPELFNQLSPAEKTERERRRDFHSARDTMRTFLYALEHQDYDLAAQCLDLGELPREAQVALGPALAYKLKYVMDRIGRVYIQEVSNDPNGGRYYFHRDNQQQISVARKQADPRQGDWLFTPETVAQIDSMFRAKLDEPPSSQLAVDGKQRPPSVLHAPAIWLRIHLPTWAQASFLKLDVYQWFGLVLAAAISYGLSRLALSLVRILVSRIISAAGLELERPFVHRQLRPLGWQLNLWLFLLQLKLLDLPISLVGLALPVAEFLWTGLLVWSSFRLIDLGMAIYTNSQYLSPQRQLSDLVVPTAIKAIKLVAVLAAAAYLAYVIGSNDLLTKMLAALGLLGLAASLASQDSLKNFFGTMLLISERPFKIGDWITIAGIEGVVESVGFRSTRLRTFQDSLITVPNSVITNSSIDNMGARAYRRYRFFVPLAYDTPIDKLITLRDDLRRFIHEHPRTRKDKIDIYIHTFNTSSIDMLVNIFFRVENGTEELSARDEINRTILQYAERLGVKIALPSQIIHLADGVKQGRDPENKARDGQPQHGTLVASVAKSGSTI
jgi:MscS family membrane protein